MGGMDEEGALDPRVVFGLRLRELRHARRLSQMALADAADLDHTYVSSCERGHRNISLVNIHRLARGLGVAPEELLKEPGSSPPSSPRRA